MRSAYKVALKPLFLSWSLLAQNIVLKGRVLDPEGNGVPDASIELIEYGGTKPLGTGCLPNPDAECTGTPVKELRGAVVRPFKDGRLTVGVNLLLASGYIGQTTENYYAADTQEVVGVRIPSYAGITFTYRFGRASAQ